MNAYLLSVIGTVLLCALLTAIAPEGKTAGAIKGIAKLACILIIISPILRFFQIGANGTTEDEFLNIFFSENVIQPDEAFIKYYSEMRIRETETALEKEIMEKYSVSSEVSLQWEQETQTVAGMYEEEKIRITGLCVTVKEDINEEARKNMWEYLTKNYCSEVLIE